MSMGSLKNGAGKTAPSDSSSGLVPECCRQTHKWHMMIINTPIRHLLCFQGCLENNVFTIKRRAQMSKEAHIIPLNGQRSTGRRTRVRRVDQSACDCFVSGGPGSLSYLIKWREIQGPNELDGAASTRSDTLPLGVSADHIISSLPSTPDNSINDLIDWDRGRCHNRFQRSGKSKAAALIYAGIKNGLELRSHAGVQGK